MAARETIPQFTPVDLEPPGASPADDVPARVELDDPRHILRRAMPTSLPGEVIGKLAQSLVSVAQDRDIDALAAAMDRAPSLFAIGVVDGDDAPVGLILRRELFDLLAKPYGREFYKKKPVSAVMRGARVFRNDLSIVGVAEALKDETRRLDDTYYLLVDAAGRFGGVFSTKNILVYLSDATARDMALARRLQSAIVRESFSVRDPRCAILCCSRMAKEVGGDFYLVKRLTADRMLVCLCDVSGKGIAASLITAVLGGVFDTYTSGHALGSFLKGVNRYLFDTFRLEYFVTGIFMELDCAAREAVIYDMGHSYILARVGASLRRVGKGTMNPPLGVTADLDPAFCSRRLPPGSSLLLFTDGIVEQTDATREEYSERRLWRLLKVHGDETPEALGRVLCADIDAFRGEEPQRDDLTFIIMGFPGD